MGALAVTALGRCQVLLSPALRPSDTRDGATWCWVHVSFRVGGRAYGHRARWPELT